MHNDIHELGSYYSGQLLKELNAKGIRWSKMSEETGHKQSYIKAIAYDTSKQLTLNSFLKLIQYFKGIDTLQRICLPMDCMIYKIPKINTSNSHILKKAVAVMKEAVKTLEIVEDSIADDNYTLEEKEKTENEINKTMETLLELKQCLQKISNIDIIQ